MRSLVGSEVRLCRSGFEPQALRMNEPMKVWALYDCHDLEGLYATKELADAARLKRIADMKRRYQEDWSEDITVFPVDVQTS